MVFSQKPSVKHVLKVHQFRSVQLGYVGGDPAMGLVC